MADPMDDRVVRGLIVCPPGDVNCRYSLLPSATIEQLNIALSILRVRTLPGTKGRQTAIEREMRRRTQARRTPVRAARRVPHKPFVTLSLQTGKRTRMVYCTYDRSGGPISAGRSRTRCPRCGAELKKAVAIVS